MDNNYNRYIIFWFSQTISQFGSAMTSFSLILWAYTQNGTAMTVSLMTFFHYVPYIMISLFAGAFVDTHSKKKIMLVTDSMATICSLSVLALNTVNQLQIWHIYLVNFMIGIANAFQGPASCVVLGKVVPQEKISQVSGMNSFSSNLVAVMSPVCAAALFGFGHLKLIIVIDLMSFLFAFLIVLLVLRIPGDTITKTEKKTVFSGCKDGFLYLRHNHGMFIVIITMALLNFFSRLTYENILSPMILMRSSNNSIVLGIVNAIMGIGGALGGMIVSTGKVKANSVKMIYMSAILSFMLGDILMGIGRNGIVWSVAGLMASLPVPFMNAGQMEILYKNIPKDMQGRIFSVRNAIQFGTIPIAILLGGFLADCVFEPFMMSDIPITRLLKMLVGEGAGGGMAVMFICTGISGTLFSIIFYNRKDIHNL